MVAFVPELGKIPRAQWDASIRLTRSPRSTCPHQKTSGRCVAVFASASKELAHVTSLWRFLRFTYLQRPGSLAFAATSWERPAM
jgi:hypothetical protein